MRRHAKREYLAEDLEQIRRFFPGATIIKALTTPFDLHDQKTKMRGERCALRRKTPSRPLDRCPVLSADCHPVHPVVIPADARYQLNEQSQGNIGAFNSYLLTLAPGGTPWTIR